MTVFQLNSLTIRLMLVLLGALVISQAINTFLNIYLTHHGYERMMVAEASEQYALQVAGLISAPEVSLPIKTARPLTGPDHVWSSAESQFKQEPEGADPDIHQRIEQELTARGISPLELTVEYTPSSVYAGHEAPAESRAGAPPPPKVTVIAGRFDGIEGWVNARLWSSPPPPPLSFHHIALDIGIVAGIGMLGLLVVTSQVRVALRSLRNATEQVGSEGVTAPLVPNGPFEFQSVFSAFNQMTARVQELLTEKDVMLGAIGHDLRTPLTSLRLQMELLEPSERRDRMIETLETTVLLLDDILELARSGSGEPPATVFDIGAIVTDVALAARDRGEDVEVDVDGQVAAPCRPDSIRRMVQNLVDNAVKYAGSARINVRSEDGLAKIVVEDEGPGLPAEPLQEILEPFRRGESSRTRSTGGAGLGLTLANAVARAHGGSMHLENRKSKGLRVTASLSQSTQQSPNR